MKKVNFSGNKGCIIFMAFICLLWFSVFTVWADDHYVSMPGGYGTNHPPYTNWADAATNIQDAVNTAVDGETVWITNGIYFCQGISTCVYTLESAVRTNTAMIVITNAITVRSVNGYSNTVVDGNYPAWTTRVFMVNNAGAAVSGLTITNGVIVDSHPYTNSSAGVFLFAGLLTNCLITGNAISNNQGTYQATGVAVYNGVVSHCIIKGNRRLISAGGEMSALWLWNKAMATDCLISENKGSDYAVCCQNSSTMKWCVVSANDVGNSVIANRQNVLIESCIISNNTRKGVSCEYSTCVRNCLIVKNGTGGISTYRGGNVENCTIANNGGCGISNSAYQEGYEYRIVNTISFYNGINGTNNWYSTNLTYTNCCIYPEAPGVNNITNAPLFVDTNVGNYRLLSVSPCVNTGINQNWMTNSFDLDGRIRIRYGMVDMGAYEMIYNGTIYRVH